MRPAAESHQRTATNSNANTPRNPEPVRFPREGEPHSRGAEALALGVLGIVVLGIVLLGIATPTSASQPAEVGMLGLPGRVRDAEASGTLVYIALSASADSEEGDIAPQFGRLVIADITTPSAPVVLSSTPFAEPAGIDLDIEVRGTTAFISDQGNGLRYSTSRTRQHRLRWD